MCLIYSKTLTLKTISLPQIFLIITQQNEHPIPSSISQKNAEKFINKYINGVREVPLIRSSHSKRIIWFNFAESGNGDLKQISSFLYFHSQKKNLFFIYVAFTITITISK